MHETHVLLLTASRIVWWWFLDNKPLLVMGWQKHLAGAVHFAFYVVILGMIASGVGMLVLSGTGPIIFGGTGAALPDFQLYLPRLPHGLGANLLIALLFVHCCGRPLSSVCPPGWGAAAHVVSAVTLARLLGPGARVSRASLEKHMVADGILSRLWP
jgi:hypothetical protein